MKKISLSALSVSFCGILLNLFLTILKVVVGIVGHSHALVVDGIHSSTDLLASFVVSVGIKLSAKPADEQHPYGHERFESVTAIIVSIILFLTALTLGYSAVCDLLDGEFMNSPLPTTLAVITSLVPIVFKEGFARFEKHMAKKLYSEALVADATHHRTDALVSIGVLIGVASGHFGFPVADRLASCVISLFILVAALEMFDDAVCKMVDKSAPKNFENQIFCFINSVLPMETKVDINSRAFGSKYYIDVILYADGEKNIKKYLQLSELISRGVEGKFENVKGCNVLFKEI